MSSLAKFKLLQQIGQGTFGKLWLALNEHQQTVVVKQVPFDEATTTPEQRDEVLNEVKLMSRLKHRNIVQYLGSFVEQNHLFIVMEYARHGDLSQFIRNHP